MISAALALAICLQAPAKEVPRNQMPNLKQMDYAFMPGKGSRSCCPTATANGLLWLDANGFTGLAPAGASEKARTEACLKELATYFKTDEKIGTNWANYFPGLQSYLQDKGYPKSTLTLYSKTGQYKLNHIKQLPKLWGIEQGNVKDGFVMLALGYFKNPGQDGRAARVDYHWATLVRANDEADEIVMHDPAMGLVKSKATLLTKDQNITLMDDLFPANTQPAEGQYWLRSYPLPEGQFATIEAILFVKVAK
ncbi:MAG: hypothetical protein ACAH95_14250 [Fimbriimonas sp.]